MTRTDPDQLNIIHLEAKSKKKRMTEQQKKRIPQFKKTLPRSNTENSFSHFCPHNFVIYYLLSKISLPQILTAGGGSNNIMWTKMRERILGVTTR